MNSMQKRRCSRARQLSGDFAFHGPARRLAAAIACLATIAGCAEMPTKKDVQASWERQRAGLKYELASNELKRGRTDSALELAQEALGLSPDNAANVELVARAYLAKGDFSSARTLLEASQHMRSPALAYLLGTIYERERNWPGAIEKFSAAGRAEPARLEYPMALAQALQHSGNSAGAIDTLKSVETAFRDQPAYFLALAEIQRGAGDLSAACDAYRSALDLGHDAVDTREELGLCLYWVGRYDEALTYLESLARGPRELPAAVRSAYAGSLLATRHTAQAEQWLTKATRRRLDDAPAWLLLAQTRLELGRPTEALDAARYAARLRPNSADAWCTLAEAQQADGKRDAAVESVNRALLLQPDHAEALLLAETLAR